MGHKGRNPQVAPLVVSRVSGFGQLRRLGGFCRFRFHCLRRFDEQRNQQRSGGQNANHHEGGVEAAEVFGDERTGQRAQAEALVDDAVVLLWFFRPKKSPTIAGNTVMLPPKQKATAPTQMKNSVWFRVMKLSATIASTVTSMVKLMTRIRPTLSDSVPRMMRPAVLKMATADTVLAAVAKSIPAS